MICECGRWIAGNVPTVRCECGTDHQLSQPITQRESTDATPWWVDHRRDCCACCSANDRGHCSELVQLGKPGRIECSKGVHRAASCCPRKHWLPVHPEQKRHRVDDIRANPYTGPASVRLVSVHFNPLRNQRQAATFYEWLPTLGDLSELLTMYELVFDDDEPEIEGSTVIRGTRERNWMWQKEALLNRALSDTDSSVSYFGWLDHDIVIEDPDWLANSIELMTEHVNAVQLFRSVTYLDLARNEIQTIPGRAATGRGNPGGMWIAKRDYLETIGGFHNAHIVGGGDQWSFAAFTSNLQQYYLGRPVKLPTALAESVERYVDRCRGVRNGITFLDTESFHLYHGSLQRKQYGTRDGILARADFDPDRDVRLNEDGILGWATDKPTLHRQVREFFLNRREDDDG